MALRDVRRRSAVSSTVSRYGKPRSRRSPAEMRPDPLLRMASFRHRFHWHEPQSATMRRRSRYYSICYSPSARAASFLAQPAFTRLVSLAVFSVRALTFRREQDGSGPRPAGTVPGAGVGSLPSWSCFLGRLLWSVPASSSGHTLRGCDAKRPERRPERAAER